MELVIGFLTEEGLEVSAAVQNAINGDRRGGDVKGDGDTAAKTRGSQTGPQIVGRMPRSGKVTNVRQ